MHAFLFECPNCGEHGVDEAEFRSSIKDEHMVRELDIRLRDGTPNTQVRLVFQNKCPICDSMNPEPHIAELKIGVVK